jgi:hypothetical protein
MARKKQGAETALDPIETNEVPSQVMSTETATAEASKAAKTRVSGERKVGKDLLQYVQENQGLPGEELALGAGYFTNLTDNETGELSTRIHKNEFFKAVTEASTGIVIPAAKRAYTSRRGRAPIITVGKTGNCVVGARHSAVAGFEPGSKVQVTAEQGRIILEVGDASEVEAAAEEEDLDL